MREVDAVVGDAEVGHCHVDKEDQRGETRCNAESEENSSAEFDQRNRKCRQVRSGKVEAGKEVSHLLEMCELAPTILCELKAPIETNRQKQRTLQSAHDRSEA